MHVKRIYAELVVASLTGLVGTVAAYGSLELGTAWTDRGPEPGYFPFYVGILLAGASAWNVVAAVVRSSGGDEPFLQSAQSRRLLHYLGPLVVFVVGSIFLGLYVGTTLYLFYVAWREGGYGPYVAAAIGFGFSVFLYLVFEIAFLVPLHKGPLEAAVGLY